MEDDPVDMSQCRALYFTLTMQCQRLYYILITLYVNVCGSWNMWMNCLNRRYNDILIMFHRGPCACLMTYRRQKWRNYGGAVVIVNIFLIKDRFNSIAPIFNSVVPIFNSRQLYLSLIQLHLSLIQLYLSLNELKIGIIKLCLS